MNFLHENNNPLPNNQINDKLSSESYFHKIIKLIYNFLKKLIIYLLMTAYVLLMPIYNITMIIALVTWKNKDQKKYCLTSNLYEYGIISIVVVTFIFYQTYIINKKANNNFNEYYNYIINYSGIQIVMLILLILWGIYEFYYVNCINNLNDIFLYKCLFVYFIFLIVCCILLSIIALHVCKYI